MPYPNEHSCRVKDPGAFQADSFRRKNIKRGINIIIGRLRGSDKTTTQAYRFKTSVFTVAQAKKWLKDNDIKCIKFEPAKNKDQNMKTVIFKNFASQVKDLDEKKGIVSIYINAFNNEDSDGDISMPGSFKRTFKNNGDRIQHWLNHDRDKMIGVPLELFEDEIGAIAISQLNMKKQLPRDVFEDYRLFSEHGKSLEHSVRVWPVRRDEEDSRKVLEWKLIMEYSTLYGWGANSETPLIDIKELKDLELMISEGNYSEEKGKEIEKLYNKLMLLVETEDPPGTQETDPPALDSEDERIREFYELLKF